MLYELRLYTAVPGRLQDIQARFRDHLPRLMAKHGIDQVARWTATAGPNAPLFVYMMAYDDLAQREMQWDAFYQDDEWWKIRSTTNAGEQMVERYDLFFLRPGRAWQATPRLSDERIGGVHELVFSEVALGHDAEAADFLQSVYLPAVRREGGDILMVADFVAGCHMPRLAMIIAWPDANTREAGRRAVDGDVAVREAQRKERQSMGRTSLGRTTVYVLEPTDFALPLASLGYR
ncbi:NIPSNAP family protein [Sphingobium sp. HWE2-09]|uniref:NIPSNAP family protein n=1 Tax=Sphingobium sp. HWE2-09 TaxID=3108390 RepID=UPI002DCD73B2|nr:NIPSNAP family protein [Sphingobium sp. HWE2-09]